MEHLVAELFKNIFVVNEELSARKIQLDIDSFQTRILRVLPCWIVWRVTIATITVMISLFWY